MLYFHLAVGSNKGKLNLPAQELHNAPGLDLGSLHLDPVVPPMTLVLEVHGVCNQALGSRYNFPFFIGEIRLGIGWM